MSLNVMSPKCRPKKKPKIYDYICLTFYHTSHHNSYIIIQYNYFSKHVFDILRLRPTNDTNTEHRRQRRSRGQLKFIYRLYNDARNPFRGNILILFFGQKIVKTYHVFEIFLQKIWEDRDKTKAMFK